MGKILNYFKEVHTELVVKTSWPSWNDLISSARVVMVAAVIIALIIFVMDFVLENLLEFLYSVLYVG